MTRKHCCRELEVALINGLLADDGCGVWIEKPEYADDGNGYIDKVTGESTKVNFCPKCGTKIIYV